MTNLRITLKSLNGNQEIILNVPFRLVNELYLQQSVNIHSTLLF